MRVFSVSRLWRSMDHKMFRFSPWHFVPFYVQIFSPKASVSYFRILFIYLIKKFYINNFANLFDTLGYDLLTQTKLQKNKSFKRRQEHRIHSKYSQSFLFFLSGRGNRTPDMQIMILLFLPSKLSRQNHHLSPESLAGLKS